MGNVICEPPDVVPQFAPRSKPIEIGVIGEAGVGKSSLINALLSERLPILPQGGIGAFTAIPITVFYAESPYVRVRCCGRARLRELLDAIDDRTVTASNGQEVKLQMARLLVGGSQFAEVDSAEMIVFIEACLKDDIADFGRIGQAQSIVRCGDSANPSFVIDAGTDLPRMLDALANHASGFLAPLTESIELGWHADLLRHGLVLVDLPGLGVASDSYRAHTTALLPDLSTLLWVVDRSGITQASVDLLHASRFLERFFADSTTERDVPPLTIAVTKLDQTVDEQLVTRKRSGNPCSWQEARDDCVLRAVKVLQSQLELEIERGFPRVPAERRKAAVASTAIIASFPRDYQRHHRADSEEPTRLERAADSGIPALAMRLIEIGNANRTEPMSTLHRPMTSPSVKGGT